MIKSAHSPYQPEIRVQGLRWESKRDLAVHLRAMEFAAAVSRSAEVEIHD
jgi:hypothetical protein